MSRISHRRAVGLPERSRPVEVASAASVSLAALVSLALLAGCRPCGGSSGRCEGSVAISCLAEHDGEEVREDCARAISEQAPGQDPVAKVCKTAGEQAFCVDATLTSCDAPPASCDAEGREVACRATDAGKLASTTPCAFDGVAKRCRSDGGKRTVCVDAPIEPCLGKTYPMCRSDNLVVCVNLSTGEAFEYSGACAAGCIYDTLASERRCRAFSEVCDPSTYVAGCIGSSLRACVGSSEGGFFLHDTTCARGCTAAALGVAGYCN